MKFLGLLSSLFWLNGALAAPADYLYRDDPEAKAVIEHSSKTDFEASTKARLVEFYSPFCGGCRNFKPKYISLAEQIHEKYKDVEVYAVSCSPYKSLCNKHKIQGYPSLFAFPEGSTEGTYLQKTSMGGTYTVSAIAEALKVDSKSTSKKTSSKAKRVLEKSDDESKDEKTSKKISKKVDDSDEDDKEEANSDDEDDDKKKTSKKTTSKKTVSKKKKDEDSEEDKDMKDSDDKGMKDSDDKDMKDSDDKDMKDLDDKDAKDLDDKDAKDSDDKDAKDSDDKDAKISDDKPVKKSITTKKKKKSEDESKEDIKTASERLLDDEKDSDDDQDAVMDDKKSDDKEDSQEDEKEDLKEDEKSDDKASDDETIAVKEDEKSDDTEPENSDDKDDGKDDEKSDDKDDETKEESDDKDDEESKDDEPKLDEPSEEKDTDDDKESSEKGDSKDAGSDDDNVADGNDVGLALGSRTSAGRLASGAIGGAVPSLGKVGKYPGAGAQKAQLKERDMDRWKQIMEQRKKIIEAKKGKSFLRPSSGSTKYKDTLPGGKVKLDSPGRAGSTRVMRARTPGTEEFEKRKKEILAKIEKAKKAKNSALGGLFSRKKTPDASDLKKKQLPFKKDINKPGLVRKTAEKVPLVKRLVRMTTEEELILDASRSFITGLRHGVFMDNGELSSKKKNALQSWLELLSISLPPEWGLHALIDDLVENINTIAKSNTDLQKRLYKHPLHRQAWSKSCDKSGGGGFSCGMWKLFHIVTVGVAEHHGGQNLVAAQMVDSDTRVFSPAEAAETIRGYMENFFGCDDCRQHFIAKYNSCAFRRCDRLTEAVDGATPDDWKQLSLWLWEVHNDVNIRVSQKKVDNIKKSLASKHLSGAQALKLTQTEESEIRVLWPSLEDCLVCFDDSGKWNEDSVFEFLERTYWDAPDAKFDRLLTTRTLEGEDPSGGGLVWIMMLIAVCIVWTLRRHVHNISFHKRIQMPTSVMGVGNKLGDAVAGKKRTA